MLGVKTYTRAYIDSCRARVDAELSAYDDLIETAHRGSSDAAALTSAVDAFESSYFNHLVILLDALFMHRLRVVEGKDGNPLNEVRVLSESLLLRDGTFTVEKVIKLVPAKTVLKHQPGDEIHLTREQFGTLSDAYFGEIEAKFLEPIAV